MNPDPRPFPLRRLRRLLPQLERSGRVDPGERVSHVLLERGERPVAPAGRLRRAAEVDGLQRS